MAGQLHSSHSTSTLSRYPLIKRLGETHSWSGLSEQDKNLFYYRNSNSGPSSSCVICWIINNCKFQQPGCNDSPKYVSCFLSYQIVTRRLSLVVCNIKYEKSSRMCGIWPTFHTVRKRFLWHMDTHNHNLHNAKQDGILFELQTLI